MASPLLHIDISPIKRSKPTLVLVHGVAGSLHIWDPVYESLLRDYMVVRMDLLGYGHSPKPHITYTPAAHAHAIHQTLVARRVTPPYTLVGLSMGATVALEYAKLYPHDVTSLVALGYPYYRTPEEAKEGLKGDLWAGLAIHYPVVAEMIVPPIWWLGRVGVLPPRLFAGIYSQLQAHETLLTPFRVFSSSIWHSMVAVDADELLEATAKIPRLFVHGEQDNWATDTAVKHAVSKYFKSRFVSLPRTGHNVVVLEPRRTVNLIREFLEK